MHTFRNAVIAVSITIGSLAGGHNDALLGRPTADPAAAVHGSPTLRIVPPTEHMTARPIASEPAPATPAVTVVGASVQQREMVAAAIDQFESYGLELPPVRVEFFETTDACNGHAGRYRPASTTGPDVGTISICHRMRLILLHELAHAWDRHNLDDETRAAFLDHRGLETWSGRDHEWAERGAEMAANTIAYTLSLESATNNPDVLEYVCDYELLTGTPLPDPSLADCETEPTE